MNLKLLLTLLLAQTLLLPMQIAAAPAQATNAAAATASDDDEALAAAALEGLLSAPPERALPLLQRVAEQAALLDKANDAILVRDLQHRILYWNRAAERLYGWTASAAVQP